MNISFDGIPSDQDVLRIANAARFVLIKDDSVLQPYRTIYELPEILLDVARFIVADLANCPPNFVIRETEN